MGIGLLGTGSYTVTPKTLNIAAGAMEIELSSEGFQITPAITSDFAVTLTTKSEQSFSLRF